MRHNIFFQSPFRALPCSALMSRLRHLRLQVQMAERNLSTVVKDSGRTALGQEIPLLLWQLGVFHLHVFEGKPLRPELLSWKGHFLCRCSLMPWAGCSCNCYSGLFQLLFGQGVRSFPTGQLMALNLQAASDLNWHALASLRLWWMSRYRPESWSELQIMVFVCNSLPQDLWLRHVLQVEVHLGVWYLRAANTVQ